MNISIKTIPHNEQRYETVGDWWFDEKGNLEIRVSELKDWRYEACVAFHELFEVIVCKHLGIKTEDVDAFDQAFEKIRLLYPDIIGDQEPGDMVSAPYHPEHVAATHVEKILASHLDINWNDYDKRVNSLSK